MADNPFTDLLTVAGTEPDVSHATLLVCIGQSHRPLDACARIIDLEGVRELRIGRGPQALEPARDGTSHSVTLDDPWLSKQHAAVVRIGIMGAKKFLLEDLGSTNGCFVNGQRVQKQELSHGDIVETGQTLWKFYQKPQSDLATMLAQTYRGGEVTPRSSVCLERIVELQKADRIADRDIPIILFGESGVGKEVMAREIHRASGRPGRFVAVNCAAIPEGLVESELFGHCKGSFTGAVADKRGVVEEAHRGTLLLDEVGDLPLAAQAKLLRLLQERTFVRVGETREQQVDVRFIAATHRDLQRMVEAETFRGDLFARLNGFTICLLPLRERREDLGLLIASLLKRMRVGSEQPRFSVEVYRALCRYDWPFNVRELEKILETGLALAGPKATIRLSELPEAVRALARSDDGEAGQIRESAAAAASDAAEHRRRKPRPRLDDDALRQALTEALASHGGNVSAVARALDTTRMQIHRWMKRLGMDPDSFRG